MLEVDEEVKRSGVLFNEVKAGSDALKITALGTKGVLVGRPYIYGPAIGGQEGVSMFSKADFEVTMSSGGLTSVKGY